MHQKQSFDLQFTLQKLVKGPDPYNQIILLSITPKLLHFKVKKIFKNKEKTFKIVCQSKQALVLTKNLFSSLHLFSARRFRINSKEIPFFSSKQAQQLQQLSELLAQISFDQICIQDEVPDFEILLNYVFKKYRTLKITFYYPMPIARAAQLTDWLHVNLHQQNIILSLQVQEPNNGQLLKFAKSWINSLPCLKEPKVKQEKTFGYPFPLQTKKYNNFGRKQQITLKSREKQLVTVRQLEGEGRFFVITGHHHIKFLEELLFILFNQSKCVSLQIEPLQGEDLVSLAEYAVMNFNDRYRLIVGHQLELSSSRMVLNTINLTSDQVKRMMKIGAQSGRYQIALYSQMNYFEMALSIFIDKPLIKFNFFLPIEEWNQKTQDLINKIQEQCRITKKNVYSYSALLKRHANLGYVFVNEVFHNLALEY